jgi:hypothetical protein
MKNPLLLSLAAAACVAVLAGAAEPAGVALFNGEDFSGWVQRGGKAVYTIEGNEIVGSSVLDTPNSFLCTERTYGDFILEYEFKVDPRLNSGVQIRSEYFDEPRELTWQGKTIRIPAGRVHGYQVEIDPDVTRGRMWSAGLFDEARRGWLYPADGDPEQQKKFSAQGRQIFKAGDWNHIRVEAVGDSIKTWLNGTPCADLRDALTPRGFIALQVHGIGQSADKNGTQVRWRNLRLTDLTPAPNTLSAAEHAAGWRLLWDGRTTDGWRSAKADTFPARGWEIADGALTVLASDGGEATAGGDIITRERFAEFELQVDFKLTPVANSGIKYLVQPNLSPIDRATGRPAAVGSAIGLEYQVLDDARHPDAKLGRDGNRTLGSLYDLIPASADKQPNAIGEWNTARILVTASRVEHWLNGRKILAYDRASPAFRDAVAASKFRDRPGFGTWRDGHILLQEHGDRVSYRNIKIRVPAKQP